MFDYEDRPYGLCDMVYRVVRMLCLLTAYVATLAALLMVASFVFATLTR